MAVVHVWTALGRFHSLEELRTYVDKDYTDDGDAIPSPFMREVGLTNYEPACIEVEYLDDAGTLPQVLKGVSYNEQWTPKLPQHLQADAIICVYAPNEVNSPQKSVLTYHGAFEYEP